MEAVGLVAVNKMAADVSNGNVRTYKAGEGALTAVSVSANSNGILYSAAATLEAARMNRLLLQSIGTGLNAVSTAISTYQTVIAFSDSNLTTGEILNAISAGLGMTSLITTVIPMISIPTGITSAVIGLISVFFSENLITGTYSIPLEDGNVVVVYIG